MAAVHLSPFRPRDHSRDHAAEALAVIREIRVRWRRETSDIGGEVEMRPQFAAGRAGDGQESPEIRNGPAFTALSDVRGDQGRRPGAEAKRRAALTASTIAKIE
jgi:hypothetical protein